MACYGLDHKRPTELCVHCLVLSLWVIGGEEDLQAMRPSGTKWSLEVCLWRGYRGQTPFPLLVLDIMTWTVPLCLIHTYHHDVFRPFASRPSPYRVSSPCPYKHKATCGPSDNGPKLCSQIDLSSLRFCHSDCQGNTRPLAIGRLEAQRWLLPTKQLRSALERRFSSFDL